MYAWAHDWLVEAVQHHYSSAVERRKAAQHRMWFVWLSNWLDLLYCLIQRSFDSFVMYIAGSIVGLWCWCSLEGQMIHNGLIDALLDCLIDWLLSEWFGSYHQLCIDGVLHSVCLHLLVWDKMIVLMWSDYMTSVLAIVQSVVEMNHVFMCQNVTVRCIYQTVGRTNDRQTVLTNLIAINKWEVATDKPGVFFCSSL